MFYAHAWAPALAMLICAAVGQPTSKESRSVLMIAVDDLRTQLSIYPEGGEYMKTPNIKRLAQRSVVFERAYVQVALCMPSRTSLLTSRRPDTSRSWTIEPDQWFRESGGQNWTTLPGAFLKAGYFTYGCGKIFHEKMPAYDPQDANISWSREAYYPRARGAGGLFDPDDVKGVHDLAHAFEGEDEAKLQDTQITSHAVSTIEKMANGSYGQDIAKGERKFFLAIGYVGKCEQPLLMLMLMLMPCFFFVLFVSIQGERVFAQKPMHSLNACSRCFFTVFFFNCASYLDCTNRMFPGLRQRGFLTCTRLIALQVSLIPIYLLEHKV